MVWKVFNRCLSYPYFSNSLISFSLSKNSYGVHENEVSGSIEGFSPVIATSNLSSEKIEQTTGKVTIADADIVVSGGRGLQSAENFKLIIACFVEVIVRFNKIFGL